MLVSSAKMYQVRKIINVKVIGQDNITVQFKINTNATLRKLMRAYCEIVGESIKSIRFKFDGEIINENDTPASLEIEDGDTIEAYQQQVGGVAPE